MSVVDLASELAQLRADFNELRTLTLRLARELDDLKQWQRQDAKDVEVMVFQMRRQLDDIAARRQDELTRYRRLNAHPHITRD